MPGHHLPPPDPTPTQILSPSYSECDSVSGLLDNGNSDSNAKYSTSSTKTSRLEAINQVVQNFRFPRNSSYSTLGSCPNLARINSRSILLKTVPRNGGNHNEDLLNTPFGMVKVYKAGNPQGPTLLTIHDLGLDGFSSFQSFFNCPSMRSILTKFSIYHITAPGQHPGAEDIPASSSYPNMDQLSEMVESVCSHYSVSHCVGMGVGMGANILVRLATRRQTLIDGLIVINCNSQTSGWMEWAYHKVNMKAIKKARRLPDCVVDYLVWHHMGSIGKERGPEVVSLAAMYRQYFRTEVKPGNLAKLLQSYTSRSDLNIARLTDSTMKTMNRRNKTLTMPVLNIVGDQSPHVDATITFNGRVDPAKCTWMKITDAGMVLEEQKEKVAEAVGLFLQGLGYTISMGRSRSATVRPNKLALQLKGYETPLVKMKVVNITEDLLI